jgi:hypothetical protein
MSTSLCYVSIGELPRASGSRGPSSWKAPALPTWTLPSVEVCWWWGCLAGAWVASRPCACTSRTREAATLGASRPSSPSRRRLLVTRPTPSPRTSTSRGMGIRSRSSAPRPTGTRALARPCSSTSATKPPLRAGRSLTSSKPRRCDPLGHARRTLPSTATSLPSRAGRPGRQAFRSSSAARTGLTAGAKCPTRSSPSRETWMMGCFWDRCR